MKIKVWNLIKVEQKLYKEKREGDSWYIRQVLDILSSNWRIAEKWNDLIINEINKEEPI